jgi:molybdopterin molybdotransferase
MLSFELFVRPALRALQGHMAPLPQPVFGRAAVELSKQAGLAHFVRVTAEAREGALWARPLSTQTSGVLRSAATATHLLHFEQQATRLGPGDPVELLPVHWAVS